MREEEEEEEERDKCEINRHCNVFEFERGTSIALRMLKCENIAYPPSKTDHGDDKKRTSQLAQRNIVSNDITCLSLVQTDMVLPL